ncbi:hypothetical protein BC830DRAFT_1087426, partial [Chytriomyces sp. MP71]
MMLKTSPMNTRPNWTRDRGILTASSCFALVALSSTLTSMGIVSSTKKGVSAVGETLTLVVEVATSSSADSEMHAASIAVMGNHCGNFLSADLETEEISTTVNASSPKKVFKMGGVRPRRLIVSTGDTTDYDGLLALQMYACAADTDAMVVLNSLAMHDGDGGSGADTLLGVFADSTAPFADAMFGKGFKAPTKGDRASIENLFSAFVRQAVAASGSNRLFVVQGGVNDINPFGHSIVKYDLEHYLKLVDPSTLPHGSACWDNLPNLNDYSSVWMDMNGSMAFYRPETPIYAWCRRLFASGKLRGLYIMGGILDSEASPLISPFFVKPGVGVNRLGCATMNQL